MDAYFMKNSAVFTPDEMKSLAERKILVAGMGGLGGAVTELLARSGIGHLVLADGDRFEPSNMNRQILCTTDTLGQSKAQAGKDRVLKIHPGAFVQAFEGFLNRENALALMEGCDLVIDALDSVSSRLELEEACALKSLPLVHGAVNGWSIQAGICPAGANLLHLLYSGRKLNGYAGGGIATAVFTCAAFQVSEAIKLLLNKPDAMVGKLLFFDLISKESQFLSL